MQAAVLVDDQRIEIRNVSDPSPGENQVLVGIQWGSICGTDLHIYLGEFKDRVKYPRILCHEFSGIVEATGRKVTRFRAGDRVVADPIIWCGHCPPCLTGHNNVCNHLKLIGIDYDGAFAERVAVDEDKVFGVPKEVPLRTAALAELYALGVHSARRSIVEPGDRVVILGAGRLGLCVLEVMKQTACAWVAVVDVLDSRLEIASKMGADFAINAHEKDPVRTVLDLTEGIGADRVVEAIGSATEIPGRTWPPQQAVRMARSGGRVVLMGLGAQSTPLLWKEVVLKELELVGSRVTHGEFPRALDLMAQGRFHPDLLISEEFDLQRTGEAFRLVEENPARYLKMLIKVS